MDKLNLYRNISITFVVFIAMILCALFLTFYSQATIIITPDIKTVNLNFTAEVKTSSTPEDLKKTDALAGIISVQEKTATGTFDVLSTKAADSSSGNIVGRVKIFNDGRVSQTLVKTTQLQASDGTIVRTNAQVAVPAGSSVEVDVFPKDPASFEEVNVGKLAIIKLPAASQKVIYGQAENKLVKSVVEGEIKFLADSDINKAKKELIDRVVAEAVKASGGESANIVGEIINYIADKKIGDETDSFVLSAKIRLKTIKADEKQLTAMVLKRAQTANLNGATAGDIDPSKIRYVIVNVNSKQSYNIKISYPLSSQLSADSDILNKENFAGKNVQDIKTWAEKTGAIKSVEVIFSPYWKKTVPQNIKRIKVIIK